MNIFRFLSFMYARENFNCYVQVMFSKIRMFCILAYVNCFANDCFFLNKCYFYPQIVILKMVRIPFL